MDRQLEKRLSDRAVAIGREGEVAGFGELLDLLRSSSANARRLAASALGKLAWLDVDQRAAVAALAPVARNDPHAQTRQYAIKALKDYGAASEPCLHDLRDMAANGFSVPPTLTSAAKSVSWPLATLSRPPATFPAPGFSAPGVQALFYESVPYQGKPTRVFAWLGVPEVPAGQTCPGIVLLHGGGGTAMDEWVRLWNARGYAAIAMDQCGCVSGAPETRQWGTHARHEHGGPSGWDDSFDRIADPIEDQWPYHAVAAAIAGHSLLAAQPGVDAGRIGITGISWGGYATCIVAAIDPRLRGAVPVYGCGFLGLDSGWSDNAFRTRPADQVRRWLDLWDPSHYLPGVTLPMCWVSGTNDGPYPLPILQKSYQLPRGPRTLCIRVEMGHSHPHGWVPAEIGVFMDSIVRGGEPLPALREQGRDGAKVWAVCESLRPITKAELCVTRALGHWTDRKWNIHPARFDAATGRIEADLPPRATTWFLNVFDDRNGVVSTPHQELEQP